MSTSAQPARADLRTLWRLARPAGMPLVLALPAVGFGFGHWEYGLDLRGSTQMAWVLLAWWFLSAGTLWLNAALDRDECEVLMGTGVVPVPGDIARWGAGALGVAGSVAWLGGPVAGSCGLACVVLAVAYSHPRVAWKGRPLLGPGVNLTGYGVLSPLAGWSVVGVEPTRRTWVAWGLVAIWVAATFFAAQAFQQREDRQRGYRTLVVTHGPAAALWAARVGYGTAVWGGLALAAVGWFPRALAIAVVPWWMLDRHLAGWLRTADAVDGVQRARGLLVRAIVVALAVILAAVAQHGWQCWVGLQPAGLGTAWSPLP